MKHFLTRSVACLALLAAVGISVPATASASSSTSTTATNSVWASFRANWKAYVEGLKSIDATYRSSVDSSRAAYFAARAAATTPAERQAARVALNASLAADLNARVLAITAAGNPPAPPAGYNGTEYVEGFQAAHIAFRASVAAAQSALSQGLASATTYPERRLARLTYEAAVEQAIIIRSAALLALGTPPTHRGQPS